jgi:hypothetical protein
VRTVLAAGLYGLGLLLLTTVVRAEPSPTPSLTPAVAELTPTPADASLAPRLSAAAAAMEYWDVTAWLESGDRFVARFLVTNQGPGVGTAAAVGHLLRAGGEVVPFKWGRRREAWKLEPNGARIKIAKAVLELGPTGPLAVEIDSEKHGIKVRLEIARPGPPLRMTALGDGYPLVVVMPAPAEGRIWVRGMDAPLPVAGTAALTHAWMERPESERLRGRVELFARAGDLAVYLAELTLTDGARRSQLVASRAERVLGSDGDVTLAFGGGSTTGGDPRYPLATEWKIESPSLAAQVTVGRELLRMNPLDILPQPFRMLLALGGRPQRIWAEATVDLTLKVASDENPTRMTARGIAGATYARPQ